MKLVLFGAVAALTFTVAATAKPLAAQQQQGGAKVAFVDTRIILRQTPGYAKAESTFTRELETYRAQVAKLQGTFDSAASAFEQSAVMLSATQRQAKQKELAATQDSLEQQTQSLQQRAAARERELLDPIQQRVNTVIEAVRAEGNYAIIFDAAAPGSAIVAADKALNLTDRVVARLKAGT